MIDALRAVDGELGEPETHDIHKKFITMECNGGGGSQKTKKFLNRYSISFLSHLSLRGTLNLHLPSLSLSLFSIKLKLN